MNSQFKNTIEIVGSVSLCLTDTITGKVRKEIYVPNLVVTTGKYYIAGRMISAGIPTEMQYMGIGLGATTEVVGNTQLSSELTIGTNGYGRALTTRAVIDNVVTYVATFPAGNPTSGSGVELREAGIFSTTSGGQMLCRTTFPIVTKLTADALTVTWTITIQ